MPDLPELPELRELAAVDCWAEDVDFEGYAEPWTPEVTREWLAAWTGNPEVDLDSLRVFGEDGSGGQTALWLVRDTDDVREQPVVHLGSEGERAVLAGSLAGFLWLLAHGCGPWEACGEGPIESRDTTALRGLAVRHAPGADQPPDRIVEAARAEFPGFGSLIDALIR